MRLFEITSREILVGGVARPKHNSEGHPIASNDEGLIEFWEWFGNSKTVDNQGRPLVFYRGQAGFEDEPLSERYFTTSRKYAIEYAQDNAGLWDQTPLLFVAYIKALKPALHNVNTEVTDYEWEYHRKTLAQYGYDAVATDDYDIMVPIGDEGNIRAKKEFI